LILINNDINFLRHWAECIGEGLPNDFWTQIGLNMHVHLRRHTDYPQKGQSQYTLMIEDFAANSSKSFKPYQITGSEAPFVRKLLENFETKKASTTI